MCVVTTGKELTLFFSVQIVGLFVFLYQLPEKELQHWIRAFSGRNVGLYSLNVSDYILEYNIIPS